MKRRTNSLTLLGNWKNYGTWKGLYTIVIGAFGTVTKGLLKGLGELGKKRMSGDYLNY